MVKEGYSVYWLVALAAVGLVLGLFTGATTFPETIVEEIEVPFETIVEVEVPVVEYVNQTVEVEKEVLVTDLAVLYNQFVEEATSYFEAELGHYDEWNGIDYDLDEISIESFDDEELVILDWEDAEYEVNFEVELEYDDGDEVDGLWACVYEVDEEGDIDLDCEEIV